MRILEPRREDQERFLPFPQRILLNGRPRSVRLSQKPRSQSSGQQCAGNAGSTGCFNAKSIMHRRNRLKARKASANQKADDGVAAEGVPEENMKACPDFAGLVAHAELGPGEKTVPGLELSGVTAEDLNDAGILYDEERHLLGSSAAANAGAAVGTAGGAAAGQACSKGEPADAGNDPEKVRWKDEEVQQRSTAAASAGLSRPASSGAKQGQAEHKVWFSSRGGLNESRTALLYSLAAFHIVSSSAC